jgi:hypothetical protein
MKKALATKKGIPKLLTATPAYLGFSPLLLLLNSPNEQHFSAGCDFRSRIESVRAAWRLRAEIMRDLAIVVEPQPPRKKSQVWEALSKIVFEVNKIGLKPTWLIGPRKRVYGSRYAFDDAVNIESWQARFGPEQGSLKIGQVECMVVMFLGHYRDAKRFFYSIIINALQNGAIEYLCRCKFQGCRSFFLTDDRRKKYFCSTKCRKAAQKQYSRRGMEIWRQNKKTQD